jgi:hypothetical protein
MLTHEPDNYNSLLHLLWRYQGRMEQTTNMCLEKLITIMVTSPSIMDFFSRLPGPTYQYARYTDWIQPYLLS